MTALRGLANRFETISVLIWSWATVEMPLELLAEQRKFFCAYKNWK